MSVRAFWSSMGARLFLVLTLGIWAGALLAMAVASSRNSRAQAQQLLERTADFIEAYVRLADENNGALRQTLRESDGPVTEVPDPPRVVGPADAEFEEILARRGGVLAAARASRAPPQMCFPPRRPIALPANPPPDATPPVCRLVQLRQADGSHLTLSLRTPSLPKERSYLLDPLFLTVLALVATGLSLFVVRQAGGPLQRMSVAAAELGRNLEREPIPVSGSSEVRRAAEALNAMQARIRAHVRDRTGMLAAISHDLQTPLTRLRLAVELVEDEPLRERLVRNIDGMGMLIDEGLELARSSEISESRVMLDLDSLLESLVQDAIDAGHNATLEGSSGVVMPLRPQAMRRLLGNLIENAIKYGGSVSVSASCREGVVEVTVRDRGPGIPESMLEEVFDPFVRIESSRSRKTGGTGIGLTIARILAQKNDASLRLRNHPQGGLEALLHWPRGSVSAQGCHGL